MIRFKATLAVTVAALVLAAAPALAQQFEPRSHDRVLFDQQVPMADHEAVYPNPVTRTGSADQIESGATFNLDRGY